MVVNAACADVEADTMVEVSQGFVGKRRSVSPRGKFDNDAHISDVSTPPLPPPLLAVGGNANVNMTWEAQAPAQRGGEDVPHSESVLAERRLSSLVPSPPLVPSASGMGRAQSDKDKEEREIKRPPPTVELASTTYTLGSRPSTAVFSFPPVASPPPPSVVQETREDTTSMKVCDVLPKTISVPPDEASDAS